MARAISVPAWCAADGTGSGAASVAGMSTFVTELADRAVLDLQIERRRHTLLACHEFSNR
jgi:hypothetical protein